MGRDCACVKLSPSGVYFFLFFLFLTLMRNATGPPAGPINSVNGSNDVFLFGWLIKNYIHPLFFPKIRKFALRPMGTSKSYKSGTFKDRAKMFAPKRGFSGSGNLMESLKFVPHWPLLPWQPTYCFWTHSAYIRCSREACTNQGVFEVGQFNGVIDI